LVQEDLCIDIGANYGNRTKVFINLSYKIVAIEPQPQPANYLRKSFKLYYC